MGQYRAIHTTTGNDLEWEVVESFGYHGSHDDEFVRVDLAGVATVLSSNYKH